MASATGLGVAMVMVAWPCCVDGADCLWLGPVLFCGGLRHEPALSARSYCSALEYAKLFISFFPEPRDGEDAPDSVVVV